MPNSRYWVVDVNTYKLACGHLAVHEDYGLEGTLLPCPVDGVRAEVIGYVSPPPVSPVTNGTPPERSYGCSWGCGNPYDYVFVSVADGTTEFLCLPCFLKLAQEIVTAVISPDGEEVMAALADMRGSEQAPMRSGKVRKRGKNAPANSEDPDLIDAFDSRLTPDELPEDFT